MSYYFECKTCNKKEVFVNDTKKEVIQEESLFKNLNP